MSTNDEEEVDIVINNVVCSFNVRCHLNLRDIAQNGLNVEYRRENGVSLTTFCPSAPTFSKLSLLKDKFLMRKRQIVSSQINLVVIVLQAQASYRYRC